MGYGHVVGHVIKLCNAQSFNPNIMVLRMGIIKISFHVSFSYRWSKQNLVKTSPVLFQYTLFTDDKDGQRM